MNKEIKNSNQKLSESVQSSLLAPNKAALLNLFNKVQTRKKALMGFLSYVTALLHVFIQQSLFLTSPLKFPLNTCCHNIDTIRGVL